MLGLLPHTLGKTGDLCNGFAFHAESHQQTGDLCIGRTAAHDDVHCVLCFCFCQILAVGHLCDILFQFRLRSFFHNGRQRHRYVRNQIQEVCQHTLTIAGQQGFGVELYAIGLSFPMFQCHDLSVLVPCSHFQACRKIRFLCDQRMVSAAGNRLGQSCKNGAGHIQYHLACLAMHQVGSTDNCSAESFTNGLMSQTHAQHRNLAVEVADRLHGDAGIFRVSRSRREDQCLRVQSFDLLNGDLVVADYLNVTVQFTDILIQIIGERIIVINQ